LSLSTQAIFKDVRILKEKYRLFYKLNSVLHKNYFF
jgi:hypothetical protein